MPSPRDIQKRIKAVGNIKRITKTMQMIATSKFARAQQSATASKPYTEGIFQLVTELAARAGNISHPLIEGPPTRQKDAKDVVLIITSDRGLCGPYNASILREGVGHLRAIGLDRASIDIVGRKGVGVMKFNRYDIARHHAQFGDKPSHEEVGRLAQDYMDRFLAGEIASVTVVYMRFISTARQRVEKIQLLPLKPPAGEGAEGEASGGYTAQYEFSPSPDELLGDLLPETVRATLFQAFSDAIVSEHVARMIAMKAATDNAGKMGKELTRKYNRARQSQITTELTEIIGGAAALE
jgi:F-type H+-transporting ATPase subunit gamma